MGKVLRIVLLIFGVSITAVCALFVLIGIAAMSGTSMANSRQHADDGFEISLSTDGFKMTPIFANTGSEDNSESETAAEPLSAQTPNAPVQEAGIEKQLCDQEETSSIEADAVKVYNSFLQGGEVTIERVEDRIAAVNEMAAKIPQSMKVNMILLQLWDMKSKMLDSKSKMLGSANKHGGEHDSSIIEAARIATRMHGLDDVPDQLRFQFAAYVYREAEVHCRNQRLDECLASLKLATEMGYGEIGEAKTRAAFANFHSNDSFVNAVNSLEIESAKRLRSDMKSQLENFESFPFDFDLQSNDGQPISLADYRGKLLLVEFWGTWCRPCVEELPALETVRKNNSSDNLNVLCLTFEQKGDRKEQIERVLKLFAKMQLELDFVLIDKELTNQIPTFRGYPTKLLLDTQGKVRAQWTGPQSATRLQVAIDLLIEEKE